MATSASAVDFHSLLVDVQVGKNAEPRAQNEHHLDR